MTAYFATFTVFKNNEEGNELNDMQLHKSLLELKVTKILSNSCINFAK